MSLLDTIFRPMNDLYTNPQELAAIWMTKPLITDCGRSIRIAPGMGVKIENGELVPMLTGAKPTHKVMKCFGTLINQFSLLVKDIDTGDETKVKI